MNTRLTLALLVPCLASSLCGQDLIHYKFDEAYGNKIINYAAGSPAPAEGTLTSALLAPATPFKPGVYGSALTGAIQSPAPVQANWIDTGWNPGTLTGSISFACWLRTLPTNPNPSLTYLFGNGTLRAYSGSGAILTTGWNSTNQYVTSRANVFNLAKAGWLHLALVLDGTTMQATYYYNGVAEAPIAMTAPVSATGTGFYVGCYNTTSSVTNYPSVYDLDEFIFANRAMTAPEILALANSSRAADGRYGAGGCGGLTLGSTGGAPTVGNATYQLTLNSAGPAAFAIALGSNRANIGGVPLPFDIGPLFPGIGTCLIDSSMNLPFIGGAKGAGSTSVGLPIPMDAALNGATLYIQAPATGGALPIALSNAFSVGIGY